MFTKGSMFRLLYICTQWIRASEFSPPAFLNLVSSQNEIKKNNKKKVCYGGEEISNKRLSAWNEVLKYCYEVWHILNEPINQKVATKAIGY